MVSGPLRRGGQINLPGCRPPQHAPGRERGLLLQSEHDDARCCLRLPAIRGQNCSVSAVDQSQPFRSIGSNDGSGHDRSLKASPTAGPHRAQIPVIRLIFGVFV